jgi:hypothetical protein
MVLKIDDINPDGVRVIIQWDKFVVGASFFITCIDTEKAIYQLKKISKDKGFRTECRTQIENNKMGVRCWRMA